MKAIDVEIAVVNMFGARRNLIVPNVSWGFSGLYYEADMIVVTKAGYAKEIEIKVSKYDLIKDKGKRHNHNCKKFNELYFAIPEALLIHSEHIPERAGIIKVYFPDGGDKAYAEIVRPAKPNGADKLELRDKYELARLGAIRIWNLKNTIQELNHKSKEKTK